MSSLRKFLTWVRLGVLIAAVLVGPTAGPASSGTPNLVVIMTDDLSTDALDALLAEGLMPNLQQRVIDLGVSFENAFVTDAICCPSRATYLRGQYAHNHGVLSNSSRNFPELGIAWPGWFPADGHPGRNESTIATWLQNAGYVTGFIGKYLNGYGVYAPETELNPETYIPPGWDDWQALIDPTTYRVYEYKLNDNGTVVSYGDVAADYQTDVLAARAVDFINTRAAANEKFFLTLTPLAPHVEVFNASTNDSQNDIFKLTIRPAPRHAPYLNGNPADGEVPFLVFKRSFNESDLSDKPSCPRDDPPKGRVPVTDPLCVGDRVPLVPDPDIAAVIVQWKSMLASMLAVDDLIGDVLDAVDTNRLSGQTVVVFTSDNGYMYGEHRLGNKQVAYEEAIRVPLYIRGPSFAAGVTSSAIVLNNDLAPTLAHLGGTNPPYDPDGASIVPLLLDPAGSEWMRRSFLVEHWFVPSFLKFENPSYSAVRSVRDGLDFLYVTWRADTTMPERVSDREFYNLLADPFQERSVVLRAPVEAVLDGFVAALRGCTGQGCRDLESF